MSQENSKDQSKKLVADDYFFIANQFLDFYQTLSEKIQNPTTPMQEKEKLYEQSKPIIQCAYEFQRMGFKALTAQLNVTVSELKDAIKDAAKTIKRIFQVGKTIEIAADLVAIAAIIAVPVLKPTALIALPSLIKELEKDIKDLSSSA